MNRVWLSFVLVIPVFTYSLSSATKDVDIRGKITKVERASAQGEGRFVGTVLVEGNKEAKVDKANLIVTKKTRILKQRGKERVQGGFEDLKVGGIVEAKFTEGPTIMIYPLQVGASEIVILNPDSSK